MDVSKFINQSISNERQLVLQKLIDYVQGKVDKSEAINLQFICTHNSRRSQFSQIWAKVASSYYGVNINSLSGGTEVTALNPRVIDSLLRFGFNVEVPSGDNPKCVVDMGTDEKMVCFSKVYDDPTNSVSTFGAVMTCAHAEENCPYIPGTEIRIPLNYVDPKEFDDTIYESEKYDERSTQIATEMFYVFSQIK